MKRFFDFFTSLVVLLFIAPLLLLLVFIIVIKLGRPILFLQPRVGLNNKPFLMIKFRSMSNDKGSDGALLADEQRINGFGSFLRSTSLDELPELLNVLKGDMSLVGPRPLLVEYLPLYSSSQLRRHEVRPGITGWAQVNGRNATTWEERLKQDVWYVENRSMLLDLKILLLTLKTVLVRKGVSMEGHATMEKFKGQGK